MTLEEAVPLVTVLGGLMTAADFLVRKWLQKHRDELIIALNKQVTDLTATVEARTNERDTARADLAATANALAHTTDALGKSAAECAALKATNADQAAKLDAAADRIEEDQSHRRAHDARVKRALDLEGAIWTQPTMANTPKFVPLADRRTPIVSVLNLKGGVGKTTVTAHLARALAANGYRVLLVDLDLQGSLSSLFVPTLELARLAKSGGRFLQHLLAPPAGTKPGNLIDYTLPVPQLGPHARLVPTTDRLAYAELSQTVQWLLRVGTKAPKWNGRRDGRMILRRALHRPTLYRKFDMVLMDCPPLINLCCANALAASDYVITPVTPSLKAIERVPPLIKRVMEVQAEVNEHLHMLGIVVNNTRQKEGLTPQESDLFLTLPEQCLTVYGSDVYRFDTTIPGRVAVRDREQEFAAADEDPVIRNTFEQLAEEFVKKLPGVCRHPDERKRPRQPKSLEGM
ncbi:MAG: AAA family ATPase [Planctomycetes bacterium]|nr:AAA family ATPase [Planctomycetota bacterium]